MTDNITFEWFSQNQVIDDFFTGTRQLRLSGYLSEKDITILVNTTKVEASVKCKLRTTFVFGVSQYPFNESYSTNKIKQTRFE